VGAALAGLAIVLPWLVWLPTHNSAAIDLLGAIAITCAWHGWGRGVARVARVEAGALVTITWGLAATVALSGFAIALHVYDARLLVIAGTVLHTVELVLRHGKLRVVEGRRSLFWLVPAAVIAIISALAVLGAAGHVPARAVDDDGSVLAQIARLADTGTLGDAIGYPRILQLGAHPALAALASAFSDPSHARLVDRGLGLALVLALACARIRPRDATGALWTTLVAITACAFPTVSADFAPLWIPAVLVLALDATGALTADGGARAQLPVGVLAGALASLRTEYAAMALVFVVAAWWPGRRDVRRIAALAGGFALVVVPYMLARALAWRSFSAATRAIVDPAHHALLLQVLLTALVATVAAPLALLIVRELPGRAPRVLAAASVFGIAGVTAFGERGFAIQLYWPIAIAAFVALAVAVAAKPELGALGLVLAFFACVLVRDGQLATGNDRSWAWRVHDWLTDVGYARRAAPETDAAYLQALMRLPHGDTVAVWIARPDLLDYTHVHIVDVRTPRAARDPAALQRLVTGCGARWLLVEGQGPEALDQLAASHHVEVLTDRLQLVHLH
jgi:hypothetical protein